MWWTADRGVGNEEWKRSNSLWRFKHLTKQSVLLHMERDDFREDSHTRKNLFISETAVIKKIIIEKSRQLQALFVERKWWFPLFSFSLWLSIFSDFIFSSFHPLKWMREKERLLFIITAHRLTRDMGFLCGKRLTKSLVTLKWLILSKRLLPVLHSTSNGWCFESRSVLSINLIFSSSVSRSQSAEVSKW